MSRISAIIPSLVLVISLSACSAGADDQIPPTSASGKTVDPNRVTVELEPVVSGLQRPVAVRAAGDGSGRVFVVEQPGRIRVVDSEILRSTPFLDITDRVRDSSNEQDLLGLAFHPDFSANGRFFVNYTDLAGDTVVSEFALSTGDSNRADPLSEAVIMTIGQPFSNHNGGDIAFGPNQYLWIAAGDGGSGGDPQGNGQNPETLLGKLLRVDVDHGTTYTIPSDNPFVNDPSTRDEIWALARGGRKGGRWPWWPEPAPPSRASGRTRPVSSISPIWDPAPCSGSWAEPRRPLRGDPRGDRARVPYRSHSQKVE
jgi:glucose/arabinose dehydrogenase